MTTHWIASRAAPLHGNVRVPGDKSVSHRAIMLACIAEGTSHITGFLEGEDTLATARVFAQLGVRIEALEGGLRRVHGVGLHGLHASPEPLDCGNAGTGMRLLAGLLAGQAFDSVLVGDDSLSQRPMGRVVEPLARMGAHIESGRGGVPPLRIQGAQVLRGVEHRLTVASAQVKSALLLAGLYASGTTTVIEPMPTRDYTERMLQAFGVDIEFAPGRASLRGPARLEATDIDVPADFSSAAFFIVAACIVPGSDVLIEAVGMNPRRTGLVTALRLMGARIDASNERAVGGEPVADLRVRACALRGIDVPVELVPDMIDEFPALFTAAACAHGDTRVTGAHELRVKESDRIATMAGALRALGITVEEHADGAVIHGGTLHGGRVESHGDHRIAMASAVAAQCASGPVRIADIANVATSFPGFAELARAAGMRLDAVDRVE